MHRTIGWLWKTVAFAAAAVIAVTMLSVGLGDAASNSTSAASNPAMAPVQPLTACQYSFEGSTQGWVPQPDNAGGNTAIWVTPPAPN